ncbi:unannotated protein [freshwater metagenome]|uniref:Unannotated protein n=1 Tax=freshwater metagenome TaxID=449393 RepID=A0A6J6RVJ4_9ZZZZ
MLWALTNPVPDERTDLGEIVPVIVFTSVIFVSLETTSLCAGIARAQSEIMRIKS